MKVDMARIEKAIRSEVARLTNEKERRHIYLQSNLRRLLESHGAKLSLNSNEIDLIREAARILAAKTVTSGFKVHDRVITPSGLTYVIEGISGDGREFWSQGQWHLLTDAIRE